jgi:O-acetyl-ADP-ribose deacetylase (regulator of RNase III)
MRITVVEGDITTQHVDAVVNAANKRMRGGGGVDGAIHRAGGPAILEECIEKVPEGDELPTGQAVATTGGKLPARWVIHVVGPVHVKDEQVRAERRLLLVSCYEQALRVADELGARTVAFPLVSAGIYGWPLGDAIRVAVETIGAADTQVEEARIVAFGEQTFQAVQRQLSGEPSAARRPSG